MQLFTNHGWGKIPLERDEKMSVATKLNKKFTSHQMGFPIGGRLAKITPLEQRILKFKNSSEKEIKESLRTYEKYIHVLQGLGMISLKGTVLADMLKELARTQKITSRSRNKSNLLAMLSSAGMIQKIRITGEKNLLIKINDLERVKASAELRRIIQKNEWKRMQDQAKKTEGVAK